MSFLTLDKAPHSPTISSPLNPESYYEIPSKTTRRHRSVRINGRRIPNPVSPTQRLLRQKAEAAWRSTKSHTPTRRLDIQSSDITSARRHAEKTSNRPNFRIDIDRSTAVTVIPGLRGVSKTRHEGSLDNYQENSTQLQRRRVHAMFRRISLVVALLCGIALMSLFHVHGLLGRSSLGA